MSVGDSVLFHAAESLRIIAALVAPVIPKTAQALWEQLGLDGKVTDTRLSDLRWSQELADRAVRGGTALFPRLDAKEVLKKMDAAGGGEEPKPAASGAPQVASQITIDDFSKVDLRVATVVEAERVKGADKLLRLIVDLGFEKRQILAGIAKAYNP